MLSIVARWVLGLGLALGGAQLGGGCAMPVEDDPLSEESAEVDDESEEKGLRTLNGLSSIPGLEKRQGLSTTLGLEPGDSLWLYMKAMKRAGLHELAAYTNRCAKALRVNTQGWCDFDCRESVSACLFALTNVDRETREVELVSGSIDTLNSATTYEHHEGTYFGDIFSEEAEAYVMITAYPYRSCSKGGCVFTEVPKSACDARHTRCKARQNWVRPIAVYVNKLK